MGSIPIGGSGHRMIRPRVSGVAAVTPAEHVCRCSSKVEHLHGKEKGSGSIPVGGSEAWSVPRISAFLRN